MLYEQFCIARQPILDVSLNTYGYELLFRKNIDSQVAEIDDADSSTMCVATCGFIRAQESLSQVKKLFVNFTEKLIIDGAPRALPPAVTVIEILENIHPSPPLIEEIIKLKQEGYLIAIDDYEGETNKNDLLDLADIVKVDVLNKSNAEIQKIFASVQRKNLLKLAEKVDTKDGYEFLRTLGVDFFQGYFFAQPENLSGKNLKTPQISKLRILGKINDIQTETTTLVNLVNSDPGIAYKLLRLINSAAFGFSMKIDSIRHAIVLLGNSRLIYWLRMVILSDVAAADKPQELFIIALARGKTLEELAIEDKKSRYTPESLFLFGLLSLIDTMLDVPFSQISDMLPLPDDFLQAYEERKGNLADYLHLLEGVETSSAETVREASLKIGIDSQLVYNAHIRALNWTDDIYNEIS